MTWRQILLRKLRDIIFYIDVLRSAIKENEYSNIFDSVNVQIESIYQDRIADNLKETKLREIIDEAKDVMEDKWPGYADAYKKIKDGASTRSAYGDYIIWTEMIDYATESKKPIIFVTEDKKDDWWDKSVNPDVPQPILRRAFFEKTGQHIYVIRLNYFIEFAKIHFLPQPPSDALPHTPTKEAPEEQMGKSAWFKSLVEWKKTLPEALIDARAALANNKIAISEAFIYNQTAEFPRKGPYILEGVLNDQIRRLEAAEEFDGHSTEQADLLFRRLHGTGNYGS